MGFWSPPRSILLRPCEQRVPRRRVRRDKGAKAVKKIEMTDHKLDLLSPEQATTFRALAARGFFLAQDRVDVAFATKELCREFAAPANASNVRLKRLARFLIDAKRLVYRYDWLSEADASGLSAFVDTDFAGFRVTRRSTNGGVLMRGSRCIKHWSTTQPTIALSSGEAEFGRDMQGASQCYWFALHCPRSLYPVGCDRSLRRDGRLEHVPSNGHW